MEEEEQSECQQITNPTVIEAREPGTDISQQKGYLNVTVRAVEYASLMLQKPLARPYQRSSCPRIVHCQQNSAWHGVAYYAAEV